MLNTKRSFLFAASMLAISVVTSGCGPMVDLTYAVGKNMPFYDERQDAERFSNKAIAAMTDGDLNAAEAYADEALAFDPNYTKALLVSALIYEKTGRIDLARARYKKLIALHPNDMSTLYTMEKGVDLKPVASIAEDGLDRTNLPNSRELANKIPIYGFASSAGVASRSGQSDFIVASSPVLATYGNDGIVSSDAMERVAFGQKDFNVIKRFVVFKRLVDEGLVTPKEYIVRREANVGALLPFSNDKLPCTGLDEKVPEVDAIVTRMKALTEAFRMRMITPREHAAERMVILNALLQEPPFATAKRIAIPDGVFESAAAARRISTLHNMGLISSSEMEKERAILIAGVRLDKKATAIKKAINMIKIPK
ncbi:MAG: tetratricopeptide repeat protein [Alphaproteobacteria bacterium]|nr:tetratricopeptide repeat protein [Alphaproteobacteria bacterium]